jgi:menaquinone-9 beta-reductase
METPILIIGAGPAGCAASYELSKQRLPHLILDKAGFPRDKICGDGLSPRVFFVLRKIYPDLIPKMAARPDVFRVMESGMGIAPNGTVADMPLFNPFQDGLPPAFSAKRLDFDNFLVEHLDKQYATLWQNTEVKSIERKDKGFIVTVLSQGNLMQLTTTMLIGADGDRSIVKKTFLPAPLDANHYLAGIRAYYNGVKDMKNSLEFFMLKSVLPGYLWIFPLANGQANVGVCMLSNYVGKHKINLRATLLQAIEEDPLLKHRFAAASLDGKIVGWGLPVGSKPNNPISGDGFMLIGDAASVIDPFSGEGIAPAFYTGMYAAQAIISAEGNYSASYFYENYDKKVRRTMGFEFRFMRWFQNIYHYPRLINFLIKIFARNQFLVENAGVLFDPKSRKMLRNPAFTLKMIKGFF